MEPFTVRSQASTRRYSSDIAQGRLEIPCQLIFEGNKKSVGKVKTFMSSNNKVEKVFGSIKAINDDLKDVSYNRRSCEICQEYEQGP